MYYNIKADLKKTICRTIYFNYIVSELISEIEVQPNNQFCIFFSSNLNSEMDYSI